MRQSYSYQLLEAIKSNDKQFIETFLENLRQAPQPDNNLIQTLIEASLDYSRKDIFDLFSSIGSNPINQEKLLNAQLRFAAKNNNLEVSENLIKERADPNISDYNGNPPLHFAAQNGHLKIIEFLVKNTANINQQDSEGWTPLFFAAYNYKPEAVQLLLQHNADVNHVNEQGHNALISMLERPSQSYYEETIICKQLMKSGTDVNSIPIEDLRTITQKKHFEVKFALMKGKILRAIEAHNEDELFAIVKYLMSGELYLKKIPNGTTALMLAAGAGYNNLVTEMLNANAEIDKSNTKGYTALTYASLHNKVDVVKKLLEHQANVNFNALDESTPLHHAAHKGHIDVAKLLLINKADHTLMDADGKTPLILLWIKDTKKL